MGAVVPVRDEAAQRALGAITPEGESYDGMPDLSQVDAIIVHVEVTEDIIAGAMLMSEP